MCATEAMQVNTSSPSEMDVTREMGFLEMNNSTTPDGLSPDLFKDGGDIVSSGVIENSGINREREQILEGQSESLLTFN